jgi:outer membrane protein OmpA-like peptidoglycan-associated protein
MPISFGDNQMDNEPQFDDERIDALLARAGRIAATEASSPEPERKGRKGLIAGVVIVGALAAGGAYLLRSGDDASSKTETGAATSTSIATLDLTTAAATSSPSEAPTVPSTDEASTVSEVIAGSITSPSTVVETVLATVAPAPPTTITTPVDTTLPTPGDTSVPQAAREPSTTVPSSTPAPEILQGTPSEHLPGGQVWPYGLYQDNIMYLRGTVPNDAIGREIELRAVEILGQENVRNELLVDPSVPQVETVVVRLGNSVLFKRGDFDIPAESEPGFVLWAAFLQSNPKVTLTVIGHADSQGSPEQNLLLAQKRAEVAADRITRNGIEPARVTAESHGESDPIASNDTVEGRALNRRVEFAVKGLFT